jgi:hypothetical protein
MQMARIAVALVVIDSGSILGNVGILIVFAPGWLRGDAAVRRGFKKDSRGKGNVALSWAPRVDSVEPLYSAPGSFANSPP